MAFRAAREGGEAAQGVKGSEDGLGTGGGRRRGGRGRQRRASQRVKEAVMQGLGVIPVEVGEKGGVVPALVRAGGHGEVGVGRKEGREER